MNLKIKAVWDTRLFNVCLLLNSLRIPQEPQQRLCSIFNIQYSILVLETSTVILRDLVVRGTNRGGLCKLDANLAATLDSGTHSA